VPHSPGPIPISATAALDARAEHALFDTIRELRQRRTVLLISHRFSTVRSADRMCAQGWHGSGERHARRTDGASAAIRGALQSPGVNDVERVRPGPWL